MIATATNALRQPIAWPSQVAAGTPTTLATLSPTIMRETAHARRPGPAMSAATSEAMPKNAPWGGR